VSAKSIQIQIKGLSTPRRGPRQFLLTRFQDCVYSASTVERREMRKGSNIVDIEEPAGSPPSSFYEMEGQRYSKDPQP
jgi:hypothetical protein